MQVVDKASRPKPTGQAAKAGQASGKRATPRLDAQSRAWADANKLRDGKRGGSGRKVPSGPIGGSGRKTNLSRSS